MYTEVNMAGRLNKIDISDIFWDCFTLKYIFKSAMCKNLRLHH